MPSPVLVLVYKMLGHLAIYSAITGWILAIDIDFRGQITLGSIIIATLVIFIAGLFTIRSKIAEIWREEAEGERQAKERCQEELNKERLSRADFEREQQEIRHELKNQIAALTGQLKVMESKTDLTAALDALNEIAAQQHDGHDATHRLLEEIRDKLPDMPMPVTSVEGDIK